mgnify:CR=1 FL=1
MVNANLFDSYQRALTKQAGCLVTRFNLRLLKNGGNKQRQVAIWGMFEELERGNGMRLDKYLKVSRLVKRRPLAKELCDQGRVEINGKVAKAGSEVKPGDELAIRFGQRLLRVRVEAVRENVRKEEADSLYTVLSQERIEAEETESLEDLF